MKSKRELIKSKTKNTKSSIQVSTNSNSYMKSFPSQFGETYIEDEQITIPTPYPQSRYMLIEDESLNNSKYTKILNDMYPPRKYLKHNLTSWMKVNKNKTKEIKFQFTNPKLKFEDYNLKKITYNNEEIGELNSVKSFQEAMELIEKLKAKLIEYELTNNENIATAQNFIKGLTNENEYYKELITKQEEKINFICDRFNIDKEIIEEEHNESENILIDSFRTRWLKRNFFLNFTKRFYRQKNRVFGLLELRNKEANVLKLKAFLSLERNYMQESFRKQILRRNNCHNVKTMFKCLRGNWYLGKISKKFRDLQRLISLVVYFKELRLNSARAKYYSDLNKKSLFKYYLTRTGKVMKGLKSHMKKSELSNKSKVSYTKFFQGLQRKFKNGLIPFNIREQRAKGMTKLRTIMDKIIMHTQKQKIPIHSKEKKSILDFHFKSWVKRCQKQDLVDKFEEKIKLSSFTQLLHKLKKKTLLCNKPAYLSKKFTLLHFINSIRRKVAVKNKIFSLQMKQKKKIIRNIFIRKLLTTVYNYDPVIKMNQILRKMKYVTFFEVIKGIISDKKKNLNLSNVVKQYTCLVSDIKGNKIYSFKKCEFIKKVKLLTLMKRKHKSMIRKFKSDHMKKKNFYRLRFLSLMINFYKRKNHYESIIANIKTILEEKSEMITKLELDSSELILHCETLSSKYKETSTENELLRRRITVLESKLREDKTKFNELWARNVDDIKNLQETLHNNEKLLEQAIKREEKLQHKYCVDIQNAIKLNKHLNAIIAKKNQILLELKLRKDKVDQDNRSEQMKLYKENANLFNEYAQIIELKELEKKYKEEEKRKLCTEEEISKLKEDKRKAEYKSELLEQENKIAFESLLNLNRK